MKIDVELNSKSIKNAIKSIKKQREILTDKAIPEFMERAAEWIAFEANRILNTADIGAKIKHNITTSWHIRTISPNRIVLYNMSWKAAFVEFGVGIVGQSNPHPNASQTDYEYNLDTPYKYSNGGWDFNVNDRTELDIPQDAIIEEYHGYNGITIYTRGTKGVWYLFNAVENFKMAEEKRLWEEIKKKYWS